MEANKLIKLYVQHNGKQPPKTIKDFFKSGKEIPLIYKNGKVQISKEES